MENLFTGEVNLTPCLSTGRGKKVKSGIQGKKKKEEGLWRPDLFLE